MRFFVLDAGTTVKSNTIPFRPLWGGNEKRNNEMKIGFIFYIAPTSHIVFDADFFLQNQWKKKEEDKFMVMLPHFLNQMNNDEHIEHIE